jgi:excisionase family DNA binding protein
MERRELTVREYAELERVTEVTVRRWVAKGAVDVRRTPGGGLRIRIDQTASSALKSDHSAK